MFGVKSTVDDMKKNNQLLRMSAYLKTIIETYGMLTDVDIVTTNDFSGHLVVKNHSPLDEVRYDFVVCDRLMSVEYYLCLETYVSMKNLVLGITKLEQNCFKGPLSEKLKNNILLSKLINDIDLLSVKIQNSENETRISIVPCTSSCVRILFPPVNYCVKSTLKECAQHLALAQLLTTIVMEK